MRQNMDTDWFTHCTWEDLHRANILATIGFLVTHIKFLIIWQVGGGGGTTHAPLHFLKEKWTLAEGKWRKEDSISPSALVIAATESQFKTQNKICPSTLFSLEWLLHLEYRRKYAPVQCTPGLACTLTTLCCTVHFSVLISRPGRSQGLLYKHLRRWLINSLGRRWFVKISLRRRPRPHGDRWCFKS